MKHVLDRFVCVCLFVTIFLLATCSIVVGEISNESITKIVHNDTYYLYETQVSESISDFTIAEVSDGVIVTTPRIKYHLANGGFAREIWVDHNGDGVYDENVGFDGTSNWAGFGSWYVYTSNGDNSYNIEGSIFGSTYSYDVVELSNEKIVIDFTSTFSGTIGKLRWEISPNGDAKVTPWTENALQSTYLLGFTWDLVPNQNDIVGMRLSPDNEVTSTVTFSGLSEIANPFNLNYVQRKAADFSDISYSHPYQFYKNIPHNYTLLLVEPKASSEQDWGWIESSQANDAIFGGRLESRLGEPLKDTAGLVNWIWYYDWSDEYGNAVGPLDSPTTQPINQDKKFAFYVHWMWGDTTEAQRYQKAGEIASVLTSDTINVEFVGNYDADASDVDVSDNYAYLATGNDLVIVDISNPTSPKLAGKYVATSHISDVAVAGNYAYLPAGSFNGYQGLLIVDVSNPSSPKLAGSYNTAGFAKCVTISGNYAYLIYSKNELFGELIILDITNPSSPTVVGRCDTTGIPNDIAVSGNYVCIADDYNDLTIVNIASPSSPALVGSYSIGNVVGGVAVSGNYAYVAFDSFEGSNHGLSILNITEPSAPKQVGIYGTANWAMDVVVSGNYAYLANWDNGLLILNITNPSSPKLVGSYDTGGDSQDVTVSGNYVYVADGNSFVILRTNLTNEESYGSIELSSSPSEANIYLDGQLKGMTPATLTNVPVGSHNIKLTKDGYEDFTTTVTVLKDQASTVSATLTAIQNHPPEIISVEVNPSSVYSGAEGTIKVTATDPDPGDQLTYTYDFNAGTISGTGSSVTFNAHESIPSRPQVEGNFANFVTVSDGKSDVTKEFMLRISATDKPDLIIQDIAWTPSNPKIGDKVTFTVTVKNTGSAQAGYSKLRLFVKNIAVNTVSINPINKGAYITQTFDWTVTDVNNLAVKAKVDVDNQVSEAIENNNELTKTFSGSTTDIELTGMSYINKNGGDTIYEGDEVLISYIVRNNGNSESGIFKTGIYIDGEEFKTIEHSSLAANSNEFTIQVGTWKATKGMHTLKVVVDADKKVNEQNENNNENTISLNVGALVDLRIAGFEITQGIQNMEKNGVDNTVPLIRGKDLVVRAFIESDTPVKGVTGELQLIQYGKVKMTVKPESSISVGTANSWDRDKIKNSLNFVITGEKLENADYYINPGDVTFALKINPDRNIHEKDYSNNGMEKTRSLNEVPPLKLTLVKLKHTPSGLTANNDDLGRSFSYLKRVYPISKEVNYSIESDSISYSITDGSSWEDVSTKMNARSTDKDGYFIGIFNSSIPHTADGMASGIPGNGAAIVAINPDMYDIRSYNFDSLTMAHELGHLLGMHHVIDPLYVSNPFLQPWSAEILGKTPACGGAWDWPWAGEDYPYQHCSLSDDVSEWGFYGFDTALMNPIEPWMAGDLMTYRSPLYLNEILVSEGIWISDYTYKKIMSQIQSKYSAKTNALSVASTAENDYLLVSGTLNFSTNEVSFNPFYHVLDDLEVESSNGTYRLEFMDSANNILQEYNFEVYYLDSLMEGGESAGPIGTFVEKVPYPDGTTKIVMKNETYEFAFISVSNNSPEVVLISPNGNETLAGVPTIKWDAHDADGDELHYMVEYSADCGTTWTPLAIDLNQTSYKCDTSGLAGTDCGLMRVTATDGVNIGNDLSNASFTVIGKEPSVSIVSPLNGATFVYGSGISFEGFAYDTEDGMMNATQLQWVSDLNGIIGNGMDLRTYNLSLGTHTIELIAEDSEGFHAVDQITISIIDSDTIDTPLGIATVTASAGVLNGLSRVNESQIPSIPDADFAFGVFKFNVSDVSTGGKVNISMTWSEELFEPGCRIYGRSSDNTADHWYEIPSTVSRDNTTITVQLTDGGQGDNDLTANGEIICNKGFAIVAYVNIDDWNPWNDPDSAGGESITLAELQTAIYDWRFGVTLSTGELVDLTRLQGLIYSWRFG